jgi:hypothetical protein
MQAINCEYKSASEFAQNMVQFYAPLTQGSRLPAFSTVHFFSTKW